MQLRELRTARSKYSNLEGAIPSPQLDVLYPETLPMPADGSNENGWGKKRGNRDRPFIEHGVFGTDKRLSKMAPLRAKRHFDKY